MFATRTDAIVATPTLAAGVTIIASKGADSPPDGKSNQEKKKEVEHRNQRIKVTTKAASQASRHWSTTTKVAHLPPSSRRMEAIAATQGV